MHSITSSIPADQDVIMRLLKLLKKHLTMRLSSGYYRMWKVMVLTTGIMRCNKRSWPWPLFAGKPYRRPDCVTLLIDNVPAIGWCKVKVRE
jgi:hypothetical protein